MSEIRKHYFLEEYCIIAPRRGRRPSDFKGRMHVEERGECVFCPGNEDKTPPATAVYTKSGGVLEGEAQGWQVRCIPNLYPALSPVGCGDPLERGFGYHEVIIETSRHRYEPSEFSDEDILRMLRVYRDRYTYYMGRGGVEFVSLFKNHGRSAGASIMHSHSQLIALPLTPPAVEREIGVGECGFCGVVGEERDSSRVVLTCGDWVAFAPYFSRHPFEVWIVPERHVSNLGKLGDVGSLALALRDVLAGMRCLFGDFDYNYVFFQHSHGGYHFHVKVFPRLSIPAGFEENTGMYINTVAPEDAAGRLREAMQSAYDDKH